MSDSDCILLDATDQALNAGDLDLLTVLGPALGSFAASAVLLNDPEMLQDRERLVQRLARLDGQLDFSERSRLTALVARELEPVFP